jgi:hypothetical protein
MMLVVSAMRDIGKDQLSEEQMSVIKKHMENVCVNVKEEI